MFQRDENDKIRMHIIQVLMKICDTQKLKTIRAFIDSYASEEVENWPMEIDDLAAQISFEDTVKILDVLKDSEGVKCGYARAYNQMFAAFGNALDAYTGADQEGE
jgi:hypothetical protein